MHVSQLTKLICCKAFTEFLSCGIIPRKCGDVRRSDLTSIWLKDLQSVLSQLFLFKLEKITPQETLITFTAAKNFKIFFVFMSLVFSLLLVFLDVSEKYLTMEQEVSLIHFYPHWNMLINFFLKTFLLQIAFYFNQPERNSGLFMKTIYEDF